MKQSIFFRMATFACVAVLALTSCDRTRTTTEDPLNQPRCNPIPPKPEVKSDFHPHRIVLGLYEGHLHGPRGFHYLAGPKEVKYDRRERVITLQWSAATEQYEIVADSPKQFYVHQKAAYTENGVTEYAPVYGLWIDYYDKAGERINDEVGRDGAFQSYQHFFTANNVQANADSQPSDGSNTPDGMLEYFYCDSNPWDRTLHDGAKSLETTFPVGLKGFFYFGKVRKTFDLNIQLWYAPGGAKTADGIAPFGEPTKSIREGGVKVIEFRVPVSVFRTRSFIENYEGEVDSTYESLSEADKAIVELYTKTFDMTRQEAMTELYYLIWGNGESHQSSEGRWF